MHLLLRLLPLLLPLLLHVQQPALLCTVGASTCRQQHSSSMQLVLFRMLSLIIPNVCALLLVLIRATAEEPTLWKSGKTGA